MKFHLSSNPGLNVFTAHGAAYVQVNALRYEQPIIVTPEHVVNNWTARTFASLTEADFNHLLELKPEVLLLGTGSQHHFAHIDKVGIGNKILHLIPVAKRNTKN